MFRRIVLRSIAGNASRAVVVLLAVTVAAAVSTAMLNLYADLDGKLHKEFRRYGANIIVTTPAGGFAADTLARVDATVGSRGIAVPFAYVIARTPDDSAVIVGAADFERVKKLNSWWSVTGWPSGAGQALVGERARAQLAADGRPFTLLFAGKRIELTPAATLRTGAAEDSRVYLPQARFEQWTGLAPNVIEVSVTGIASEVEGVMRQLRAALPAATVEPVRQIVEAEGRVLRKTRGALLGATSVVVLLAALCLLATLSASVLSRRKDFAVMKALGASPRMIDLVFLAEIAAIGLAGALAGYAIGSGLAVWIAAANFHAAISPNWGMLPVVVLGTLLVAGAAALAPLTMLRRVQAASLLRGE